MKFISIILGLLLCGAVACGSGGSSPPDNSNHAGASGDGGNSDNPPEGGDGGGGSNSAGGAGGDMVAQGGSMGGDPGVGGNVETGGQPGVGGSGGEPLEQCPDSIDDMEPRSPCLLAGRWEKMDSSGWLEITVTKTSSMMFTINLEGEDVGTTGTFTGNTLPLERELMIRGRMIANSLDIDDDGYLINTRKVNGEPNGGEKFSRSRQ